MSGLPDDASLYQQAPCGLLVTDAAGLILRVNATLCRWLGYSQAALVNKVRIQDRLPVGARIFYQTHCLPILHVQGSVGQLQMEIRDAGGQRVPVLVSIGRRTVEGRVFDEWSLQAMNERRSYERELLAARKTAEQALDARLDAEAQLRSLNAELSDADRRKDEFLATLSHELRNPLAPMRSALEILKLDQTRPAQENGLLDVFDRQLRHMTHLVDDLMEVSRITQNRMELRREPVALADIVRSAVDDVDAMVRAAAHTLAVHIEAPNAVVDADPVRLGQVLVNLLTNACKYTPNGGKLALTLRLEGEQAVVEVQDNGIGLPEHALGTIFAMFSQLEPALRRSKGGLGIGLALVRGIVALHGGTVGARSPGEGLGSTFTVRLPLAPVQGKPDDSNAAQDAVAPTSVLVVDDNVDAAEMLAMFLAMSGCTPQTVHTANAALGVLESFRPQVALLDIGLPDLTGYELARRIRALPGGADMLLIAATGWGQASDRQLAFEAGFDHHLTKPIDFDRLRAILAEPKRPT